MTVLISLEGAIGCGKSTLFHRLSLLLKDKNGIEFVEESVDQWSDHGFLQDMYRGNISKATFQHLALASFVGDLQKALARQPAVIISERSPFSNYHVFAKANLEGRELEMYEFSWNKLVGALPSDLEVLFLYLDAPMSTLLCRVIQRMRDSEDNVSVEYQERIRKLHEQWFSSGGVNWLAIDATGTKDEVYYNACQQIDAHLYNAALRQMDEMGTRLGRLQTLRATQVVRAASLGHLSASAGLPSTGFPPFEHWLA